MKLSVSNAKILGVLTLFSCCRLWGQSAVAADQIRNLNRILSETRPGVETAQALKERSDALYALMDSDPAQALSLALPPDRIVQLVQSLQTGTEYAESYGEWHGPAIAIVEDDFRSGRSRVRWQIRISGQLVELYFGSLPPVLGCERDLQVRGIRLRNRLVASWAVVLDAPASTSCGTTGAQQTAVLLVRFPSTPLVSQVTASMLQGAFFGPTPSVDSYYREVSYGQTWLSGSVYGPFTLNSDYSCETSLDAIAQAAIRAADSVVDFRTVTRIVIIMPLNGNCTGGKGTVGCQTWTSPTKGAFTASVSWIMADPCPLCRENWLTGQSTFRVGAHEFGHNLGLQHSDYLSFGAIPLGPPGAAGEHGEYGDWFSIMGQENGHIAAPQKVQLGWLAASNVQTVETSGTFLVQPFEIATGGLQALKVRRDTTADAWLWLESRQPLGYYDCGWQLGITPPNWNQASSGTLVHYEDSFTRANYPGHAHLIDFTPGSVAVGDKLLDFKDAALQVGKTWVDPYSNLSLTIADVSSSGLSVTVNYANPPALSIAKTHTGTFLQGQNGVLYTLRVSNAPGAGATRGTVTVTESVPAGLSLISMAGTGWTCPMGGSTCTRNDALNGGASYPTITVTANVSPSAGTPLLNRVSVSGGGSANSTAEDLTSITQPGPVLNYGGVVNGASFQPGTAAGSWVTIRGKNLANTTRTWRADEIVDGRLPTVLDGVSVTLNNKPTYIYFISPTQINFQAPSDIMQGLVNLVVNNNGLVGSLPVGQLQPFAPAFFQYAGTSYAIATRYPDNALIANPDTVPGTVAAQPGDVLTLWGTGFGPTVPTIPAGVVVPAAAAAQIRPIVTVGGVSVNVIGAALSPGSAGLYQVAIQLPDYIPTGEVVIQASADVFQSPAGIHLYISGPTNF